MSIPNSLGVNGADIPSTSANDVAQVVSPEAGSATVQNVSVVSDISVGDSSCAPANGGAQLVSPEVDSGSVEISSGSSANGEAEMFSHEVVGSSGLQGSLQVALFWGRF